MNSRQDPAKRAKLKNTNPSLNTTEEISSALLCAARKARSEEISPELLRTASEAREMFIYWTLRELTKNLQNLNYNLLLAARLSSIDDETALSKKRHFNPFSAETTLSKNSLARVTKVKQAAKYLKFIIHTMSDIFSKADKTIFNYLDKSLKSRPVQNNAHVLMLANILLNFKKSIEKTGLLSKQAGIFEEAGLSEGLNAHFNWIVYFHSVIKRGLIKMSIDEYTRQLSLDLMDKLRSMQNLTYQSLQINFCVLAHKYTELARYTELEHKQRNFNNINPFQFFGSLPNCGTPGAVAEESKLGMKRKL